MTPEPQTRTSPAALWFGLLGGAIAWTGHLLLAYLIAEFGCETGMDRRAWAGVMLPAWMLLGQSAAMLAAAAAATLAALACRRRLTAAGPPPDPRHATELLMANIGAIAGGVFTFIIIVQSVPIFFYLQSC